MSKAQLKTEMDNEGLEFANLTAFDRHQGSLTFLLNNPEKRQPLTSRNFIT